jgi:antitoxin ParD1/3/4
MAKNTSISLGEHFDGFIAHQLNSGRYGSASEVVRAGLRLLEDTESKLGALRQMLADGEASGTAEYSYDQLIAELDEENGK